MSKYFLNQQILAFKDQGYNLDQIAAALDLDTDQVRFVIEQSGNEVDLNKLDEDLQIQAKLVLKRILEDRGSEDSDRIAAARIILTGQGKVPDTNAAYIVERYKSMRKVCNELQQKQIEINQEDLGLKVSEKKIIEIELSEIPKTT